MRSFLAILAPSLFVLGTASCAPDVPASPGPGPEPGTVGGACLDDGSCDEGLVCDDGRCAALLGDDDAGTQDGGRADAGSMDAGSQDGGAPDGGGAGGGSRDGGDADAGSSDAGSSDGDAGHGGATDGGAEDGGVTDGGGAPTPCDHSGDCAASERCQLAVDDSGAALEATCAPAAGASGPGAACTNDADCSSGLCVGNFCSALCTSANDCGADQVCRNQSVTVDGVSGAFDLCITLPDLECTSNDMCMADGRVCGEIRFAENPLKAYCALPNEGGADFGEACTGQTSRNSQCEEQLCLYDRCTRMCVDDTDCQGAPSGFACTDISFTGGGSLRMCVDGCSLDGDCSDPDHLCVIGTDATDDEFEWVCRVPTRSAPPGTACPTQPHDCDHGVCIRSRDAMNNVVDSYCSLPCETSNDCPMAIPVCKDVSFRRPTSGDPQILRVCGRD